MQRMRQNVPRRPIVFFGKEQEIVQAQQSHATKIAHWIVALQMEIEVYYVDCIQRTAQKPT